MFTPTQDQKVKRLKKRLVDKGISITELGRRIGHSRSVTSRALNHRIFPRVLTKIERELY